MQASSALQEQGDARSKPVPGAIFAVCFRSDVEGSGLFHGGDFVIVTRQWHAALQKGRGGADILGQEMMTESRSVFETES